MQYVRSNIETVNQNNFLKKYNRATNIWIRKKNFQKHNPTVSQGKSLHLLMVKNIRKHRKETNELSISEKVFFFTNLIFNQTYLDSS